MVDVRPGSGPSKPQPRSALVSAAAAPVRGQVTFRGPRYRAGTIVSTKSADAHDGASHGLAALLALHRCGQFVERHF